MFDCSVVIKSLPMPKLVNHVEGKRTSTSGVSPDMTWPKILVCSLSFYSLIFTFCLWPAHYARAALDTSRFATRNWLREDGLPQNSVTAVAQASDGYMWVGTYSGLARFDGVRFTVFDNNSNPALHNCRVTSLYPAPDGALWIGHENGEVTCYRNGHFAAVDYHAAWPGGKICGMGADGEGDIWLLNDDGLLARIRDGRVLTPPPGAFHHVLNFAWSPSGVLWVERDGQVSALEHGQLRTFTFDHDRTNSFVGGMGLSRDGGLWISCAGLCQKWKENRWVGPAVECPWGQDPLTQLLETQTGLLVASTSDRGLFVVNPDGSMAPSHYWRANGFAADWIISLADDREGNLWAATGNAGLAWLRPSVIERVNPPDQWQGRAVQSVTVGRDGAVWAGTEGAAVYQFQAGTWKHFNVSNGLTNYYVWSVAEDEQGNLWAGTWGGGLYEKRGEIFHLADGFDPVAPPITAIFCEAPGCLWLGTAQGLVHYEAGRSTLYAQDQPVRTVLKDRSGAVWFGMSGGGMGRVKEGVVRHFGKGDGLLSDFVQCFHEDDSNAMWIGTFGGGLSRYKDGRLTTISSRQGLADNIICDIEEDGLGYYWMSSYSGLLRVRKASLDQCADGLSKVVECDTFGISDGMPTLECSGGSQPSGWHSADGLLWFATSRGVVTVHPRDVKYNPLPPSVIIEKMIVDGKLMPDGLTSHSHLRIPPGQHRLEFDYTGLSFAAPEKVCFKHRLENLETGWIDAGTERRVDYNYIPPGNYVFHVIACNNDGVWNETGAEIAFTMLPYFWQTTWFHVLGGVSTVLVVSAGVWFDTRRRMRRKVELLQRQQAVERERTRIAKDIHDDLGASLTRINLLSQTARRDMADPPQTVNNLDQICVTARQLTRAMDEIVWAVDPQHDSLDSLASYLGKLIHEVLGGSGVRCRLDFPGNLPAWPVTAEVRHNLFLACKEALHNALKHAHPTEVRISLALEPAAITVTVNDNGCGFNPVILTDAANGSHPRPRLNGLLNMRKRLEQIGGSCEIQTQPGQGTQVKFFFPVGEMVKQTSQQPTPGNCSPESGRRCQ